MTRRTDRRNEDRAEPLHEHAAVAGAPGASGPGEPGYEGDVTIGEDAGVDGATEPVPARDDRD